MNSTINKTDEDSLLIKKMKNGDTSAIEVFIRKYYPDILKYCERHTSSKEDAMDLTQEVFMRFFSNFSSYKHYGKAKNYLYVIAGNLCINHYKSRKDNVTFDENFHAKFESVSIEERMSLKDSVQNLPLSLQTVIELYYYQGLKIREISKILNISIPLVKYRLSQAKKQIKTTMEGKV